MARILVLGGIPESLVNFRWELLKRMVATGHQVYAAAPNASQEIRDKLLKIEVVYKNISLDRSGLNPIKDFLSIKALYSLLQEITPDVFLAYTIKPVVYGSIAARLTGVPNIYSMIEGLGYAFTGSGFKRKVIGYLARFLYRHTLRYQKKVFFLNPDDYAQFMQLHLIQDSQQAVIINGIGIDLDVFLPAPYPKTISFLLVARLVRDKGVNEYVNAARVIKQQYPNAVFKLAGFIDKNPTSISEKELCQWHESGLINYLGFLSKESVIKAVSFSAVYVLPSYREGLPVTVMEAMAMARPIITTDVPGCRETVRQGKNGFLVPAKDVTALVKAMKYFLDEPQQVERMGKLSREIAEEKFDVHKVNAAIIQAMDLAS